MTEVVGHTLENRLPSILSIASVFSLAGSANCYLNVAWYLLTFYQSSSFSFYREFSPIIFLVAVQDHNYMTEENFLLSGASDDV